MSESNGISHHSPVAVEAIMSTDNRLHVKETPHLNVYQYIVVSPLLNNLIVKSNYIEVTQ